MKLTRTMTGAAALFVALAVADAAAAQQRGRDRDDDDRRDRRERVEARRDAERIRIRNRILRDRDRGRDRIRIRDRRDSRFDRGLRLDRGRRVRAGPAFCRSGRGHPVWGRRWCIQKGFGLGIRDRRFDRRHRFDRRRGGLVISLPDIILGRRHGDPGRLYRRGTLVRADLGEVVGLILLDRLLRDALGLSRYDSRRITGRWHDTRYDDRRYSAWWQAGHRPSAGVDAIALQLFLEGERLAELADLDRDGRVDLFLR